MEQNIPSFLSLLFLKSMETHWSGIPGAPTPSCQLTSEVGEYENILYCNKREHLYTEWMRPRHSSFTVTTGSWPRIWLTLRLLLFHIHFWIAGSFLPPLATHFQHAALLYNVIFPLLLCTCHTSSKSCSLSLPPADKPASPPLHICCTLFTSRLQKGWTRERHGRNRQTADLSLRGCSNIAKNKERNKIYFQTIFTEMSMELLLVKICLWI